MAVIIPETKIKLTCELCDAKSSGIELDDQLFPTEEGWVIIQVNEVVPNPEREAEAEMIAEAARRAGEPIPADYQWGTAEFLPKAAFGALCPKHRAKADALASEV